MVKIEVNLKASSFRGLSRPFAAQMLTQVEAEKRNRLGRGFIQGSLLTGSPGIASHAASLRYSAIAPSIPFQKLPPLQPHPRLLKQAKASCGYYMLLLASHGRSGLESRKAEELSLCKTSRTPRSLEESRSKISSLKPASLNPGAESLNPGAESLNPGAE